MQQWITNVLTKYMGDWYFPQVGVTDILEILIISAELVVRHDDAIVVVVLYIIEEAHTVGGRKVLLDRKSVV